MIGIVDYGIGNLRSVCNALKQIGIDGVVCKKSEEILRCDRIILPGVGSFAHAMENINASDLHIGLREFAISNRPLLGICLGMQLLFDIGEEHGHTQGLGILPGKVSLLQPNENLCIPHVGWNSLIFKKKHPVFGTIKKEVDYYFVHSFHCLPLINDHIIAECDYGGSFVAVVGNKNIIGMQFHPEKSQPAGLIILENFIHWDGND